MRELAIIILNWNGHKDTIECLESLVINEKDKYNIFLLDNNSKFESKQKLEKWIKNRFEFSYKIIEDDQFLNLNEYSDRTLYFIKGKENLGFAKGNNFIFKKIKDEFKYILLLNNDTIITENSITNMLNHMNENNKIGALSCDIRNYYNKNKLWSAGGKLTWYGERKYFSQKKIDSLKKQNIQAIKTPFITGCVMLLRKETWEKVGLLTEKFFFGQEDVNYCKRMKAHNIKVKTLLDSVIYHKVSASKDKMNTNNAANYILHFSNRIIDQKEFYNAVHWNIWRLIYILVIFLKFYKRNCDLKEALNVIKNINYYSSNFNEIDYNLFKEILQL